MFESHLRYINPGRQCPGPPDWPFNQLLRWRTWPEPDGFLLGTGSGWRGLSSDNLPPSLKREVARQATDAGPSRWPTTTTW